MGRRWGSAGRLCGGVRRAAGKGAVPVRPGAGYRGASEIDLAGAFVAPGLIDAHVHIESSLCTPPHFASAVVPRGVTTVVTDPHEIANVAGIDGIRFMIESSRGLPLRVIVMVARSNTLEDLLPLVPRVLGALPLSEPGAVTRIGQ